MKTENDFVRSYQTVDNMTDLSEVLLDGTVAIKETFRW